MESTVSHTGKAAVITEKKKNYAHQVFGYLTLALKLDKTHIHVCTNTLQV